MLERAPMPDWRFTGWPAALVVGLSGCAADTPRQVAQPVSQEDSQQGRPKGQSDVHEELEMTTEDGHRKLSISRYSDGDWVRLGVLEFDNSNRQATLTTEGSGPLVNQLEQDWYAIEDESELMWKRSVPHEKDGEVIMRSEAVMVRPGDERYIYAVFNTLERSYGYRIGFAD
jgi:hypothetical protein